MRLIGLAVVLAVGLSLPPLGAEAQLPGKTPRIGLLSTGTDPSRPLPPQWLAFFEGMRALGWIEGQNIQVERRFAAGRSDRVAGFAAELARLNVDVIVATGLRENQAARQATTTIPVVMIVVDDPVETGLVQSLARPGTNFIGVTFSMSGIGQKYVEILKEAVPSLARAEILASRPQRPAFVEEMQTAARALGVALSPPTLLRELADLEPVLARIASKKNSGLIFPNDAFTTVLHRRAVVGLVAKYRLPAIYASREEVERGGLIARTGQASPTASDRPQTSCTRFSRVLSLPTCPSSNPRRSN